MATMILIIPRQLVTISDNLMDAYPDLSVAIEDQMGDGLLPGVWKDGSYYVWGDSHTDEGPEAVTWVMTESEFKRWQRGRLDLSMPAMFKRMQRAKRLYPELFFCVECGH